MLCSGHCYIVFVVSRCIQGIILSLPLKNSGRCVSMPKAQVIDGVMFCCCSVDTCANLWSKTRWGEMYVGMLLLYSRYVIVNGEPVCCKPPQNEGLQKKKIIKMKKRTWIIQSKYSDLCDPNSSQERTVATFFFSLQVDDNIWSFDVNKLELICFKYPLNWHCWNRCICVWHCGQPCCCLFFWLFFFLYVNKESS